jgi:hypothetical protein
MKHVLPVVMFMVLVSGLAWTQEMGLSETLPPDVFRREVDMRSSLATLTAALDDPDEWDRLSRQVILLDGVASSLSVYLDEEGEYYAEINLVNGAWRGVDRVEIYKAWIVLDNPTFSGLIAERAPRDPPPGLIVRNDRVLVAGRVVDIFVEDDGSRVPVVLAYDIRAMR